MAHIGTVRPDGGRIKTLREGKGWTVPVLAEKAGVSARRLREWEQGREGFPSKLDLVARALGLEGYAALTAGAPPVAPKPASRIRLIVEVVTDQDEERVVMSEVRTWFGKLVASLADPDAPALLDVRAGSTVFVVELSPFDVTQLFDRFEAGALAELRVTRLDLPEGVRVAAARRQNEGVNSNPASQFDRDQIARLRARTADIDLGTWNMLGRLLIEGQSAADVAGAFRVPEFVVHTRASRMWALLRRLSGVNQFDRLSAVSQIERAPVVNPPDEIDFNDS